MNVAQRGIITLLKSAVTEQALPLPEGFDMETAASLAERHHIAAIVCEGAVLCGLDRNGPQMQRLIQIACKMLMVSTGQVREVERVCKAFEENGIDYMLLKGCKMKMLYPKPELRTMGDADILIRFAQYEKIKPIVAALGYALVREVDYELVWQNKRLYLELHKQIVSDSNQDFYSYFQDGWRLAHSNQGHQYFMTAEDEWIYLFTHFAKHYRGGGIGCRHVVDLWVYRRANPALDEDYIRAELKKLGLSEFYENICRLLQVWFADAPADEKMDFITDFIFASGSWGTLDNRVISQTARSTGKRNGKAVYIFQMIFPSLAKMKQQYPLLIKAPWLLPVMWIVRWLARLFNPRVWKKQSRNLKVVTADSVKTRQEALQYVGLDFNF